MLSIIILYIALVLLLVIGILLLEFGVDSVVVLLLALTTLGTGGITATLLTVDGLSNLEAGLLQGRDLGLDVVQIITVLDGLGLIDGLLDLILDLGLKLLTVLTEGNPCCK